MDAVLVKLITEMCSSLTSCKQRDVGRSAFPKIMGRGSEPLTLGGSPSANVFNASAVVFWSR